MQTKDSLLMIIFHSIDTQPWGITYKTNLGESSMPKLVLLMCSDQNFNIKVVFGLLDHIFLGILKLLGTLYYHISFKLKDS